MLCPSFLHPSLVPISSVRAVDSSATSWGDKAVLSRTVVLTREKGKNDRIRSILGNFGIPVLEFPLIEHKAEADFKKLPELLRGHPYEWVVITSPEAASLFLEGWNYCVHPFEFGSSTHCKEPSRGLGHERFVNTNSQEQFQPSRSINKSVIKASSELRRKPRESFFILAAGLPDVKLAVTGSGAVQVFEKSKVKIDFVPTKADGRNLLKEFPKPEKGRLVLCPLCTTANRALENGLMGAGFDVMRLNIYSTVPVKRINPALLDVATAAPVVTFSSIAALWAWVDLIHMSSWSGAAACMNYITAKEAKKLGLTRVYYPDNAGIDGLVLSILEAYGSQTGETCSLVSISSLSASNRAIPLHETF